MTGESNTGPQETDAQRYDRAFGRIFADHLLPVIEAEGVDIQHIISVACGMGLELGALMRLLPHAQYLGVDSNEGAIAHANNFNEYKDRAKFIVADLRDENSLAGHAADLLMIRNPQIARDSKFVDTQIKDWEAIFRNSLSVLQPGGIVYLSTIFPEETRAAEQYLRNGGVDILSSAFVYPLEEVLATDTHVIIGKKQHAS